MFSKSRDLYVFLQAYERGATSTQPLVAFVSFYQRRGEGVRNRAAGRHRRPGPEVEGRAAAVQPVRSRSLPPGRYDCQVTVLDPTGQKAAFWQAPIVLVP